MVQNILYLTQKNSNKIWVYRELNKEQLSLLQLLQIHNRIGIKIRDGSRC
jgi:hypothetical protein